MKVSTGYKVDIISITELWRTTLCLCPLTSNHWLLGFRNNCIWNPSPNLFMTSGMFMALQWQLILCRYPQLLSFFSIENLHVRTSCWMSSFFSEKRVKSYLLFAQFRKADSCEELRFFTFFVVFHAWRQLVCKGGRENPKETENRLRQLLAKWCIGVTRKNICYLVKILHRSRLLVLGPKSSLQIPMMIDSGVVTWPLVKFQTFCRQISSVVTSSVIDSRFLVALRGENVRASRCV